MQRVSTDKRIFTPFLVLLVLAGMAIALPDPAKSLVAPGPAPVKADFSKVVPLARQELKRNPVEKRGNNVPRYHNGNGKIAPYSIRAFWCVAFATWVWSQAGVNSYLGTDLIWKAYDGTRVAVQVQDMTSWAKRTGRWSYRARPGYLIAYGRSHMGIVEKADREGRAVRSIEGNKSDRVSRVNVPMSLVSGYISPNKLTPSQYISKTSVLADVD
ncbi:MAG: CHAP domain-containing protein [Solirubrobacterales bacterium]